MDEVVSNASKSQVEINLERELANLGTKYQVEINLETESLPVSSRMYKVPQILHDANKEAFTPKVISIGPYHCRSKNLYYSHALKIMYFENFLLRSELQLGSYIKLAQGWEEEVCGYYGEECGLNSDEFVQMILMDGIFIVEFTLQQYIGDSLIMQASLKDDIVRDLTLLENQLPFFVLQGLADHSFPGNNHRLIFSLTTLFIHHFHLMPNSYLSLEDSSGTCNIHGYLLDFIHVIIRNNSFSTVTFKGEKLELSRSATELHKAGVKLGCAQNLIFTDIDFMEENGLLQIPRLVVNRNTESLFRNIIAYEQCHHKGTVFRSYVILMDYLINTSEDVELLVDSGIIRNSLGESEDVCTLFNNLYKMPMMDCSEFRYGKLCQSLNEYRRDP